MEKNKLREIATTRSALVLLLAFTSFGLGAYSEKASFTAWGWAAIVLGVIFFSAALFLLMRDFWSAND